MAVSTNLFTRGMKQRLGGAVFYQQNGRTIARELAAEVSNPRTPAQMDRRVRWANLVNFYKISKDWMPKCYENKPANNSYYNRFMALNINENRVALTKEEARQGGVVAAPYLISQGSLPSIEVTALSNGRYASSLALGSLQITSATTIAQFSDALKANNSIIKEGMQLSFISYQQQTNNVTGVPYCVCGWYEVTIDVTDSRALNDVMPITFAAASVENNGLYLGTGASLSSGAFAWILSQKVGSNLRVSSQRLTMNESPIYTAYSSTAALNAAVTTYGEGQESFLAPGYSSAGANVQRAVNSITALMLGDVYYTPGVDSISVQMIKDNNYAIGIRLANMVPAGTTAVVRLRFHSPDPQERVSTDAVVSGNTVTATSYTPSMSSLYTDHLIKEVIVELSTGEIYSAEFGSDDPMRSE